MPEFSLINSSRLAGTTTLVNFEKFSDANSAQNRHKDCKIKEIFKLQNKYYHLNYNFFKYLDLKT